MADSPSSSKHLCIPQLRAPESSCLRGTFSISPGSQRKTYQLRLGERGILLGPFWARATEQKCKDGLSTATGMEPAGTCSHPAPAGSHIVMDEGQEPAPDLCPGGVGLSLVLLGPLWGEE